MADTLTFWSWWRDPVLRQATAVGGGRVIAEIAVTLEEHMPDGTRVGDPATATAQIALAGPADIAGLDVDAIVRRFPAPGAQDAEGADPERPGVVTRVAHVEFADPRLPWRHTPVAETRPGRPVRPWLVLVVAPDDGESAVISDGAVVFSPQVRERHPLGRARLWAHVQRGPTGAAGARVLSPVQLAMDTAYVAILVPAFTVSAAGAAQDAWTAEAQPKPLRVLDSWRFRTAKWPGDFRSLAAALRAGRSGADTGTAAVRYPRLPDAPTLPARGALAATGSADARLAPPISADLARLRAVADEADGRPAVGLPYYGAAWTADADRTRWGKALNGDPRLRGAAGLGRRIAVDEQERLVRRVVSRLGAVAEADQRIRHLATGLDAARSLWRRRRPTTDADVLLVVGPAAPRLVTETGTLLHRLHTGAAATGAALLSSAGRRVLRGGPARARLGAAVSRDAVALVAAANTCPAPPAPPLGATQANALSPRLATDLRRVAGGEGLERLRGALPAGLADLRFDALPSTQRRRLEQLRGRLVDHLAQGGDPSHPSVAPLLAVLALATAGARLPGARPAVQRFLGRGGPVECYLRHALGSRELVECLEASGTVGPGIEPLLPELPAVSSPARCRPVDLPELAAGLVAAFDPTGPAPPAHTRVYSTLEGVAADPDMRPLELCPDIGVVASELLAEHHPDWLLPAIGSLPADAVIALEPNRRFIEACLIGLNQQLVDELKWRSVSLAAGCTPVRRWWARTDPATGRAVDDIEPIAGWARASDLGAHATGAAAKDAVILFHSELFHRYPKTLLYLVAAGSDGGAPPAERDPDERSYPGFRGVVGERVAFFGFPGIAVGISAPSGSCSRSRPRARRSARSCPAAQARATPPTRSRIPSES